MSFRLSFWSRGYLHETTAYGSNLWDAILTVVRVCPSASGFREVEA